jgi:hypothetical protein
VDTAAKNVSKDKLMVLAKGATNSYRRCLDNVTCMNDKFMVLQDYNGAAILYKDSRSYNTNIRIRRR